MRRLQTSRLLFLVLLVLLTALAWHQVAEHPVEASGACLVFLALFSLLFLGDVRAARPDVAAGRSGSAARIPPIPAATERLRRSATILRC